jgi:hypothetical protein
MMYSSGCASTHGPSDRFGTLRRSAFHSSHSRSVGVHNIQVSFLSENRNGKQNAVARVKHSTSPSSQEPPCEVGAHSRQGPP